MYVCGCIELQSSSLRLCGVCQTVHNAIPDLALMRDQGPFCYTGFERHLYLSLQSSELGPEGHRHLQTSLSWTWATPKIRDIRDGRPCLIQATETKSILR